MKRWFKNTDDKNQSTDTRKKPAPEPVNADMDRNRRYIKEELHYSEDLHERTLSFANKQAGVYFFIDSVTDSDKLSNTLRSIYNRPLKNPDEVMSSINSIQVVDLSQAVARLIQGETILFFHDHPVCFSINTRLAIQRDVSQPESEQIVRGAHNGFVENIATNVYQVRHLIQQPSLTVRYEYLGKDKHTKVAIVYVDGLCDMHILEETRNRLRNIDTARLISSAVVEEHLEDHPYSPLPQYMSTERPDRCALNLLQGKIVLFIEGEAIALVLPVTFFSFYQSNDDYNSRWYAGTFFRLLRLFSFITAVTLPGIYIAIISFHYEIIPYGMTFVFKDAVEMIPYPPLIEAFFMELTLELIREAGVRLPSPIGQTIGIVGGLVIGDAVVNAGFVSSVMIIVVALTAISSFVVPANEMNMSIRLLRFPVMIMASLAGFVGIVFCLTLYLIHLCKLTSLGKPYFYPFAPFDPKGIWNEILRLPHVKPSQGSKLS
ncbi:spore germination protein [Paenalkalicoccus suaedae]|uniref:Spore germination protein n=1 Tax=Paenalkalicoccus suaedae TaxID=2592382 RepID=A0A859FF04_9BACI|nr:spore germination protein [Paenalkalicoccus suaedae]QKS70816.1 spore germination protein [Paenalkalicoccus suaedae]